MPRAARRLVAAELAAVERLVVANAALRAALTDTACPAGPAGRGRATSSRARCPAGPARLAAFAASAVPPPRSPAARLAGPCGPPRRRGPSTSRAAARPAAARERGRRATPRRVFEDLPTAELEEHRRRAVPLRPDRRARRRRCAAPSTDRDLPLEVAPGPGRPTCSRARCQPATLRLVALRHRRRPGPRLVGTLYWLVDQTAAGPGLAGGPGAGGRADRRRPARPTWPSRSAAWPGAPVELQVIVDAVAARAAW